MSARIAANADVRQASSTQAEPHAARPRQRAVEGEADAGGAAMKRVIVTAIFLALMSAVGACASSQEDAGLMPERTGDAAQVLPDVQINPTSQLAGPLPALSMSRVPWNFGGGPVIVRPRSWSDCAVRV